MKFVETKEFEPGELILWEALKQTFENLVNEEEEDLNVAYHGLPVLAKLKGKSREPDVAILDKKYGLIIIEVKDCTIDQIEAIDGPQWYMSDSWYGNGIKGKNECEYPINQARQQMFALLDQIKEYEHGLLINDEGKCLIDGNFLACLPYVEEKEFTQKFGPDLAHSILFKDDMSARSLKNIATRLSFIQSFISDENFRHARCAVSRSKLISPVINRPPKNKSGRMHFLRECKKRMTPLLSLQQEEVANSIPDGPQRIRGLAGTGKTIVMALRVAHIYKLHPEWSVFVTYGTRALYQTLGERILQYIQGEIEESSDSEEEYKPPKNLKIGHAQVLIKDIGYRINSPYERFESYTEDLIGNSVRLIRKIEELKKEDKFTPFFDYVIADESQDLPDEFLKLCLLVSKNDRFTWGIDEMQQLGDIEVKTPQQIFGNDQSGNSIVDLNGSYKHNIPKDLMLNVVYRTPRPILIASHVFGLGLKRKEGAVQCPASIAQWEDIGYKVSNNKGDDLLVGEFIDISRPKEFSPHQLEKLVPFDEIIKCENFDNEEEELSWVAGQIQNDIEVENLDPEEILVLNMNNRKVKTFSAKMKKLLEEKGVKVFTYSDDDNKFRMKGKVSIQTLRRAKGNEAGFVYVTGMDYVDSPYYDQEVLTRFRNYAFTAMTRSSGYLTITANGLRGKKVIEEIEDIRSGRDTVTFEVPDSKKLRQLYTDDMNKNLEERQKNEEFFKLLQEQMKSKRYLGKEEYRLFKKLEAKFSTIENDNEDNEYLF